jgi:hypothetical protein
VSPEGLVERFLGRQMASTRQGYAQDLLIAVLFAVRMLDYEAHGRSKHQRQTDGEFSRYVALLIPSAITAPLGFVGVKAGVEAKGRPTMPVSLFSTLRHLARVRKLAGMDGNRTHLGPLSRAPQTVLKTAGGTSPRTSPPPG